MTTCTIAATLQGINSCLIATEATLIPALPFPSIVLGGPFGERTDRVSFGLLDRFVELGGRILETAHCYADGESEKQLGRWLANGVSRSSVLLIDKGCHPDNGIPHRVTPECLREDLRQSLERLGTDYIDIYLLHRDDPSRTVQPMVDVLAETQAQGWIRSYGFCNWRVERIDEAIAHARTHGLPEAMISSCHFSLARQSEPMWPGTRAISDEDWVWHQRKQFPLLCWSALARGWFTGAYLRGERFDGDVERVYHSAENRLRYERACRIAHRHGWSPVQTSLAFVLSQPFPVAATIGPETQKELDCSMAVASARLQPDELQELVAPCP